MPNIYIATEDYDEYSFFMKKYNFSSSFPMGKIWYSPEIKTHTFHRPVILIVVNELSEMYQSIQKHNKYNPNVAYIDYTRERYWFSEASMKINMDKYNLLYNMANRVSDTEKFTFFARIQEDYSIKVEFPDKQHAFTVGLAL